jgi:hypothetical protein
MKQYKNVIQTIQNTVNARIHITKTPTHTHTHTLQNKLKQPQHKLNSVQGIPKLNSKFIEGSISFIAVFTKVFLNPGLISSCHSPWFYKFNSYCIISKLNTGEAKRVEGEK